MSLKLKAEAAALLLVVVASAAAVEAQSGRNRGQAKVPQQRDDKDAIRLRVEEVLLPVSVHSDLGRLPPNLQRTDFILTEDGKRQVIWSSEMHAFRLPSPDLWRDILQKMKASGFNSVALYFSWGFHSPKRGVYDFTGIRGIDRLLDMAAEEGLYVITRAGPYVNAELTRGGFPGWLVNQRARQRVSRERCE